MDSRGRWLGLSVAAYIGMSRCRMFGEKPFSDHAMVLF
jgi:hypothetical protein